MKNKLKIFLCLTLIVNGIIWIIFEVFKLLYDNILLYNYISILFEDYESLRSYTTIFDLSLSVIAIIIIVLYVKDDK